MTLSWMEPDMPNGVITRYQIEIRASFTNQSLVSQNTTSLTYTVTGLSPYTQYDFRVAAATRVGLGPYTSTITKSVTGKYPRNTL